MLGAFLDTVGEMMRSFPVEAVATIAIAVGGGGLILTGWRHFVRGIQGFFAAINAVLSALVAFMSALVAAFGATVGGLIILALGLIAIWWAFLILSGG